MFDIVIHALSPVLLHKLQVLHPSLFDIFSLKGTVFASLQGAGFFVIALALLIPLLHHLFLIRAPNSQGMDAQMQQMIEQSYRSRGTLNIPGNRFEIKTFLEFVIELDVRFATSLEEILQKPLSSRFSV